MDTFLSCATSKSYRPGEQLASKTPVGSPGCRLVRAASVCASLSATGSCSLRVKEAAQCKERTLCFRSPATGSPGGRESDLPVGGYSPVLKGP